MSADRLAAARAAARAAFDAALDACPYCDSDNTRVEGDRVVVYATVSPTQADSAFRAAMEAAGFGFVGNVVFDWLGIYEAEGMQFVWLDGAA